LRILHVITRLIRGGAQVNTMMCAAEQARRGHEVTLVTGAETGPEGSLLEEASRDPYRLVVFPDLVRDPCPSRDLRAFLALWSLMGTERFDVVHTHTSKAGILGRWAAFLRRVPAVVHTPHGHVFHGYFSSLRSRVFREAERATARVTHRMVALTEGDLQDHLEEGIAPPERFAIIPSGVTLERYRRTAPPSRPEGVVTLGFLARLVDVKGPLDLLEAMARLAARYPRVRLVMVGDGPLRPVVEERIRALDLQDRVDLLGRLEDPVPALHGFDVFVMPSHNEGMGRAAVEAMAAGLPVVATRVGGLPDVVQDGLTGLVIPPRDPEALAAALTRLLDDEALRARMGQAGLARAEEYSDKVMFERLEALYTEVLAEVRA
jgi:glycosyltransferase involved in cell wall biosynthesis